MADRKELTYTIGNIDKIFDESSNTILAMREVDWGHGPRLELRKWYVKSDEGKMVETPAKGFSFLTEEGPHELVSVMIEQGYGHTDEILSSIKTRDDFKEAYDSVIAGKEDEEYYDAKDLLEE